MAVFLYNWEAYEIRCTENNWYCQLGTGMSDFSEELIRPTTEDEQGEKCVSSGTGMCFPWLQKHIETIATGGKQEKDFAQTTSACLSFIQEALLKHQWQKAAEYMHSYLQILEDSDSNKRQVAPEIIWRLGSEILYYHPNSSVETFNTFADRMKNIGVMNYLKISLQHALYLLHHGMLEDANRNLSQAETWRYGEKSSSQEVLINLIQAYKGLLQYYTWSKKKMELSQLDKEDYAFNAESQTLLNHSWKTSVNLCALIQTPGVWDPFVKSYVEMLEFYGDRDGAREVLTNYAYDEKFPSNPNAHVYLYSFLKREKAPREKLLRVLKDSERPAPCRAGETEAKCEFPAPSPREFFAILMDHGCHRQHHTLGPAAGHPAAQQSGRASCQLLFEGPGGDRDTFQRFRKRQLPGPQGRGSETTSANPVRGGRRRRKETRAGAEGAPRRAGARPERAQRSRAPTMLAAPSRARSPQAPWLLSASRILCLCLAVVLGWAGLLQGHPQCLDYGPPFQPLLPLEFCSDYDNFGCCDQRKDRRIAARYWDIMEYFDLKGHELCGGYIKDILCQLALQSAVRMDIERTEAQIHLEMLLAPQLSDERTAK
uniref:HHIP like 2 n=2 Tax=Sus scrofa TaxID=9823 RepID=A0A8D0NDA1_PIG